MFYFLFIREKLFNRIEFCFKCNLFISVNKLTINLNHNLTMPTDAKKAKLKLDRKSPNYTICEKLLELGDYEKNINSNRFKYNAYRKAASILNEQKTKIKNGKNAIKLPGIGKSIASKIDEYFKTGTMQKLEKINKDENANKIRDLERVEGIGPTRAKNLIEEGIKSVDDLEENKSKLTEQQKIGLKYLKDFEKTIPRKEIDSINDELNKELKKLDPKYEVVICGNYRRGAKFSDDINVLVTHPDHTSNNEKPKFLEDVSQDLEKTGFLKETISLGNSRYTGACQLDSSKPFRKIQILASKFDEYYPGILYLTGSDLFNQKLRKLASDKGFILNQYSLRKLNSSGTPGVPLEINSEKDIFDYLGIEYKKPEEREITDDL